MLILALDTTTDTASLAVADEAVTLGESDFAHRMDLSRRLMPKIISLLKDCGLGMKDVEAIGVSLGPGSFTGLRIGVVTAKTLAQVLGVPISGIVSLDLLARQFDYLAQAVVCPLVKVRRGEVYYAFFRADRGSVERISDYDAGPIEKVIQFAKDSPPLPRLGEGMEVRAGLSEIIFCGDALDENLEALRQALGELVIPAPPWLSYPKASILAQLALKNIAQGKADDPLSLVPFYIRRSAPEMRLEAACE
ncbi:MAG TPA: tRNA (adenosine(37)-N6)-threonylcarbamoyltransferase complex dimerization subunit type 1 TsaB [Armatimonadota bacterium]|nr:tRNA (adenosine(37)-N6)-threonylcarbamoyltransferase complex dimerization subunit type 1 TsaB [Armatimonadota bacterium]